MIHYFIVFIFLTFSIPNYSNMLKDMALMMGAQIGASEANREITQEFQDTFADVQKDQTVLNNQTSNFLSAMQTAQNTQMTNISTIFSQARTQVKNIGTQEQQEILDAQSYIQSVVSLQQPTSDYLDNPIVYDQLFTNGTMYTPQGIIWKNVFQVGDWEYDENNESFWQYKITPFVSTNSNPTIDTFKNFIFTEWNPKQPYEIVCDITLYKVSYPFYAGIIFNKARWISGDTYGLQKYRTLGIYGDTQKKIHLCFAQQKNPVQNKQTQTVSVPLTPIEQIYQGQGIQNITINQNSFKNLQNGQTTFHIKIKPGPNSVLYKIWGANSPEPSQYTTITIPTNNSATHLVTVSDASANPITYLAANSNDIYMYHDIGFLSPGAVAEFKLKGPQKILFSQKNITAFKNELSNYFNDQQYKFASGQLMASTSRGA